MGFCPLNPEIARALIEGQEDILSKAAKEDEALYENCRCPTCSSQGSVKMTDPPKVVFGPDGPVIASSPFGKGLVTNGYAKCLNCGTEYYPRTGVIRQSADSIIRGPHQDPHQR